MIEAKINEVCAEYYAATQDLEPHGENYAETLKRLHALLQEFPNPPFTLQARARARVTVRVRAAVTVRARVRVRVRFQGQVPTLSPILTLTRLHGRGRLELLKPSPDRLSVSA